MRQAAWLLLALAACGDGAAVTTTAAVPTTGTAPQLASTTTIAATPPTTTTATTTTTIAAQTTSTTSTTLPAPAYVFPVEQPANYGPDHHDYPATDIFAPVGAEVYAVTGGVVDEVGYDDVWDPAVNDPATRGGLYFSLIGDDGVRYYYSHFDSLVPGFAAGTRVKSGQLIGTVGNSGNARTTPPHIHFGLSLPTFPGDWEVRRGTFPPYDYLNLWADGVDATPPVGN